MLGTTKMVRPLLIIKAPNNFTAQRMHEMRESIGDTICDEYLVLIVNTDKSEWEFQCFYEKDMNKVKFEELKNIVKESCA